MIGPPEVEPGDSLDCPETVPGPVDGYIGYPVAIIVAGSRDVIQLAEVSSAKTTDRPEPVILTEYGNIRQPVTGIIARRDNQILRSGERRRSRCNRRRRGN